MRFLADAGMSSKTVAFLQERGHDAVHVRTLGLERASDVELVERAREDSRVVLTFDLTSARSWPSAFTTNRA